MREPSILNVVSGEGEIFRAICDREVIDLFLNDYDARSHGGTLSINLVEGGG